MLPTVAGPVNGNAAVARRFSDFFGFIAKPTGQCDAQRRFRTMRALAATGCLPYVVGGLGFGEIFLLQQFVFPGHWMQPDQGV